MCTYIEMSSIQWNSQLDLLKLLCLLYLSARKPKSMDKKQELKKNRGSKMSKLTVGFRDMNDNKRA